MSEAVNHPAHYGGGDDPYEHIKVVQAWGLNYELGNCTKYICRAGRKPGADTLEDLKKARWYLDYEIRKREAGAPPLRLVHDCQNCGGEHYEPPEACPNCGSEQERA